MSHKFLRPVSAILAAILVCLSLSSCSGRGFGDGNTVNIKYHYDNYDMIIDSSDKIKCDYLLVYHESASYPEIEAFLDLLEELSASSTLSFQICPDTLIVPNPKQKIILLGSTNYDESIKSASIISAIRKNNYFDYLIRSYDNTVTVNWMSKYGRESAFDYISETLLPEGLGKLFNTDYSMLYLSDRSDSPVVTIDDVNIVQYIIVLPGSPTYAERNCAEYLVNSIKKATGVEIPIITDVIEESTYEILVGNTNRGETAVTEFYAGTRFAIAQYGTKLIVRGGCIEATAMAEKVLGSLIENAAVTAEPFYMKANYCYTGDSSQYGMEILNGYNLVYSEEFDCDDFAKTAWRTEQTSISSYGEASSLMYFYDKCASLNGLGAVISTYLSDSGYVSADIKTDRSLSLQYGYIETRARFKTAPGYWVRFFLTDMNPTNKTVSQIDVFNTLYESNKVFGSLGVLEYDKYYENYIDMYSSKYEAYREGKLDYEATFKEDEYHTYGVEWTSEYVRFFVDGVPYGTVDISNSKYDGLRKQLYLSAMAGVELTSQKTVDEEAGWPVEYTIDWVHIYQREGSKFSNGALIE